MKVKNARLPRIKSCPFCGDKAKLAWTIGDDMSTCIVRCTECGAEGNEEHIRAREAQWNISFQCIQGWNARSSNVLMACPHCGDGSALQIFDNGRNSLVYCETCLTYGGRGTKRQAIEKWNQGVRRGTKAICQKWR